MGTRRAVCLVVCTCVLLLACDAAAATTIVVRAGDDLQSAIDRALPGDTILLEAGATFTGNFRLPAKIQGPVPEFITIRSDASDALVPPAGVRITPAAAPLLARLQSPNTLPALATAPAASYWRLMLLEFGPNSRGYGDIISLGSGASDQSSLAQVSHHLVLDRLYIHGDPVAGQKRGIALHSGDTTVTGCYIADIKGAGLDTQAVMGYNGPGPYRITNNYLEGAGENFLLGGASPFILNLVPSNVEFRHNYVAKPLAWREPILATPSGVTASAGGGGTLTAGTYSYRIVAARPIMMDQWAWSARSTEVLVTVPAGGRVTLSWGAVPGATVYRVYRGTAAGAQDRFFDAPSASFVDDGTAAARGFDTGTWVTPTRWTVKNLFELKAAQHVTVDGNVFENVWLQSQTGYAFLFTPRNQDNTSPGIYVRDVQVTNNIIRHAGSGFQILGYDDNAPSGQTQRITIRNNIIHDIGAAWGGSGRFVQMGDEPRDIVIDHNTVVHDGMVAYVYGLTNGVERPVWGFQLTNNLFRHNDYGIMGENRAWGNDTITTYFPDGVVTRNTFAGGWASRYPAGNEFPDVATWQNNFRDFAAANFRLIDTSAWRASGTDGGDLGANIDAVEAAVAPARSGDTRPPSVDPPVSIVGDGLPMGRVAAPYSAGWQAIGGSGAYNWSAEGLPAGLTIDATSGVISGTPTAMAAAAVTIDVRDAADPDAGAARSATLEIGPAATQIQTATLPAGRVAVDFSVALAASGGQQPLVWSIADGTLPGGLTLSAAGVIAGTPLSEGTFSFSAEVRDSYTTPTSDRRALAITILPAAVSILTSTLPEGRVNEPYIADILISGGARPVTFSVTAGTLPAGLALDAETGRLSGSPTASGSYAFDVTATDAGPDVTSATRTFSLAVAPPGVTLTATPLPSGVLGVAYVGGVASTGGAPPVSYTLTTGVLPPGLSLDSATGAIAGTPTASGVFDLSITARDSAPSSTSDTKQYSLAILAAPSIALTIAPAALTAPATVALTVAASDPDGEVARVDYYAGGSHIASATAAPFSASWSNVAAGSYLLTAVATDNSGLSSTSAPVTLTVAVARPAGEIVVYASDVTQVYGAWQKVADPTAAAGQKLATIDAGWETRDAPLASPAHYFETSFNAAAGSRYRVWLRLRATGDLKWNESVWVQFSDTIAADATPVYRIGTTSGLNVNLENCTACGVRGWGWQTRAHWLADTGEITLGTSGHHVLRIQVREDGVQLDQIVLTPVAANLPAPGALMDDATIVPKPAPANVVIHAADFLASSLTGAWRLIGDASAADGVALSTRDAGWAATSSALASPVHAVDIPFAATAGTPYTVWLRMKASSNSKWNDSLYVQFSDAWTNGQPAYPIGTASALVVNLANDNSGRSLSGWGWQNTAYWLSQSTTVTFATTGTHTLRIQVREDGASLDQVVLSPAQFITAPPGPIARDATIVPR